MFGTFRYILAIMVMITHLWPSSLLWAGFYAVFSFFLLSGYLMTLVLNERYGFDLQGLKRFFINRALRIYPPYLAVLCIAALVAIFLPAVTLKMNPRIILPSSLGDVGANLFIIGAFFKRGHDISRLVPPVYSLHVELVFYILMALLLARGKAVAVLWFVAGLAYTVYALFYMDFVARYYTVIGCALPFSLGSLIYFFRRPSFKPSSWLVLMVMSAFIANVAFADRLWRYTAVDGFYASLVLTAIVVLVLGSVDRADIPAWMARTDKFLGDLSYPIFLVHWHVAVVIVYLGLPGVGMRGGALFFIALPVANIVAFAIHLVVERRLNRARDRIRERAVLIRGKVRLQTGAGKAL
ncbi:MAG: acyltransferase family protein [Thermodesulfobacteriota bacterium]